MVDHAAAPRRKSTRAGGQGRPLGFILTGGEASDYRAVPGLLAMAVSRPSRMLANNGYDADAICEELLLNGTGPVIPPASNRKNPQPCDYRAYKDRNFERMFNRIKQFRRIATLYDKAYELSSLTLPRRSGCTTLSNIA
ncbi:hypothetical protein [Mesorhizobium sp. M0895]|uniref:hypothetical protein n=1 Tax=Mesorhizobium sp. M0895 TaxID=2957019 RepID=UPI0033389C33